MCIKYTFCSSEKLFYPRLSQHPMLIIKVRYQEIPTGRINIFWNWGGVVVRICNVSNLDTSGWCHICRGIIWLYHPGYMISSWIFSLKINLYLKIVMSATKSSSEQEHHWAKLTRKLWFFREHFKFKPFNTSPAGSGRTSSCHNAEANPAWA